MVSKQGYGCRNLHLDSVCRLPWWRSWWSCSCPQGCPSALMLTWSFCMEYGNDSSLTMLLSPEDKNQKMNHFYDTQECLKSVNQKRVRQSENRNGSYFPFQMLLCRKHTSIISVCNTIQQHNLVEQL